MKQFLLIFLLIASTFSDTWKNYSNTTNFIHNFISFRESPRRNMLIYGEKGIAELTDNEWVHQNSNNSKLITDIIWDLSFISNDSTILQTSMGHPPYLLTNDTCYQFTWDDMNSILPLEKDTLAVLMKAKDGAVWFTSFHHGAFRYKDGIWDNFDSSNTAMPTNYMYGPNRGVNNDLWFMGAHHKKGGLVRYDGETWTHWDTSNCVLKTNFVNKMVVDKNGDHWFATDSGFVKYDGVNWSLFDTIYDGTPVSKWCKVSLDRDSVAWLYTGRGFAVMRDTGVEYIDTLNSDIPTNSYTTAPLFDLQNNFWAETSDKGVIHHNGSEWVTIDSNVVKPSHTIRRLFIDSKGHVWGKIWIKNDPKDLIAHYDGTNWEVLSPYNTSLANDTTFAINTNKNGTVTISTKYGISQYHDKKWSVYDSSTVGFNEITSLVNDSKGNLWAGSNKWQTGSGLARFNGSEWKLFTPENSALPDREIHDIAVDKSGVLWIGHTEGLSTFDGSSWNHWSRENGLPDNKVTGIDFDKKGNTWIATPKGAARFTGSTWEIFDSASGALPRNYLFDVAVDTYGKVWFGSLYSGMLSYNGAEWSEIEGAPSVDIRKVEADPFGNIWTSSDMGVGKFDGSVWTVYDSSDSDLPENRITGIAFDSNGSKWFATKSNGVAQLTDSDITAIDNSSALSDVKQKTGMKVLGDNLQLTLAGRSAAKLNIYDLRGRLLVHRNLGELDAGVYSVPLDQGLSRGCYIARVSAGDLVQSVRVVR